MSSNEECTPKSQNHFDRLLHISQTCLVTSKGITLHYFLSQFMQKALYNTVHICPSQKKCIVTHGRRLMMYYFACRYWYRQKNALKENAEILFYLSIIIFSEH